MRLALRVGTGDVDGLLDTLTPQQWQEWQAFDAVVGLDRGDDVAHAIALFAVAVTRFLGHKFTLREFIPRLIEDKPQSVSQMRSNFEHIATIHNAALQG